MNEEDGSYFLGVWFQDHECYLDEVFLSTVHIYVAKIRVGVHNRERSTKKERTFMENENIDKEIDAIGLRLSKLFDTEFRGVPDEVKMAALGRTMVLGSLILDMNEGEFQEFLFHIENEFMEILKKKQQ